jgi:hypothetical protein
MLEEMVADARLGPAEVLRGELICSAGMSS